MNRRKLLWAALLAVPALVGGGLAYASTMKGKAAYTCPVTGEELPCERCCPLNGGQSRSAAVEAKAEEPKPAASDDGDTCPITGEKLGCPNCCPLNKAKK